jgi:hypothetical protein
MPKPEDAEQARLWLEGLQKANPGGVIEQGSVVYYRNPDAYQQAYQLVLPADSGTQFLEPNQPGNIYMGTFDVVTTPRHPSQLYQMLLEGFLLFAFLVFLRKRVKRAGMIVAAFFIGYPLARFIGEFFRQPDVQFQQQGNELGTVFMGLSMGQVLSLIMMGVGVVFLCYFKARGRVIADEPMWPPDAPKEQSGPVSLFVQTGMGGSSAAGDIAGLDTVRAALAEKEKEWSADTRPEGQLEREHDDDSAEPDKPERSD